MRDCLVDIATLAQVDLSSSPEAYHEAMRAAYWEDKDLAGATAIAFAGISRLLAEARHGSEQDAGARRSSAKALTYDLASFTWPGWDEPGIIVTPPEMRSGYAAARANLAMAEELDKGDVPLSRAYWMLGAHELASGHYDEARTSFARAAETADRGGEVAEAALARCYGVLAGIAVGAPADPDLSQALASLEATTDGSKLVAQVTTARGVFEL